MMSLSHLQVEDRGYYLKNFITSLRQSVAWLSVVALINMIIYSKEYFLTYFLFKFSFRNCWLNIDEEIDEPSNIIWVNIQYPSSKRCCRVLFSILVSLIILLISIAIIGSGSFLSNEIKNNYDVNVQCDQVDFSDEKVVHSEYLSTTLTLKEKSKVYCFCLNKLTTTYIYTDSINFAFSDGNKPCELIINNYLMYNGFNIGVAFIIAIFNELISQILEGKLDFNLKFSFI